jgi:hypothetical protein
MMSPTSLPSDYSPPEGTATKAEEEEEEEEEDEEK